MTASLTFSTLQALLADIVCHVPDPRTGDNTRYIMAHGVLRAIRVIFRQSPSFLACQRDMQRYKGNKNAPGAASGGRIAYAPAVTSHLELLHAMTFVAKFAGRLLHHTPRHYRS